MVEKLQIINEKYSTANKTIHELKDSIINKDVEITHKEERIQELLAKIKELESIVQTLSLSEEEKIRLIHSLK